MAGIAGIAATGRRADVDRMLDRIAHRGKAGRKVLETEHATLGAVWPACQATALRSEQETVEDSAGWGHYARAQMMKRLTLQRDPVGIAPLYYGRTAGGTLCFASEVKALRELAPDVHEMPPGHSYDGQVLEPYYRLQEQPPFGDAPDALARELLRRLSAAVSRRVKGGTMGAWLSGGLDSSALSALASPQVGRLHTFASGLPGSSDLDYARQVARFIKSNHHEVVVSLDQFRSALPDVIYHLESFDALLVRSSVTNYLVAKAASDHVEEVFSGEGGDELFGGYNYLQSVVPVDLGSELIDITARLHNTALQRVDRCASAHGTVAHVCFLDPDVVHLALRIPAQLKLKDGIGKWILRRALDGLLPEQVLSRPKAKFWEGTGLGDQMAQYAEQQVTDADFARERTLANGLVLNTREELLYYRIFEERFGRVPDLTWMGRTKGAPRDAA